MTDSIYERIAEAVESNLSGIATGSTFRTSPSDDAVQSVRPTIDTWNGRLNFYVDVYGGVPNAEGCVTTWGESVEIVVWIYAKDTPTEIRTTLLNAVSDVKSSLLSDTNPYLPDSSGTPLVHELVPMDWEAYVGTLATDGIAGAFVRFAAKIDWEPGS